MRGVLLLNTARSYAFPLIREKTFTVVPLLPDNASLEANIVKDFDKVEMILQALEYEAEHGKVLDEFFISTAGKFQTEIGKSWAAEINARRKSQLTNRQRLSN